MSGMDDYKKHTSKKDPPCFDPCKCPETGGTYQELSTMGAFAEALPGSRVQRITNNNYKKTDHDKKPSLLDMLNSVDTGGPPYDDVSRPHRIF